MKLKKSEALKIVNSINAINAAPSIKIPWKINMAIQSTLAKLEPEAKAINKAIELSGKVLNEAMTEARKEYADKVKDKDGKDIPLIMNGKYVTTVRESELAEKLSIIAKEISEENAKIEASLNEELDVMVFQFSVTEEDEKIMKEFSGAMLSGLLPLIK